VNRALVLVVMVGCTSGEQPTVDLSNVDQAATVCGSGPTVKGIDVSYYQGTIDWAKVQAAGVEYAFIRASDGSYQDTKFATNWAESRANGILHGAYQFFRPGQDPIAQADSLLAKMGPLQPDDLPPVIDVEAADGLSPAQVAAKVKLWIDHVTAAIGRPPIIYTGFYFWRDSVGAPDYTTSPLWHAQYSTVACPNIAPPWQDWAFWQYTSSGSVNGIAGNVDTNRFNGTRAQLLELTAGATAEPCGALPAEGGTIDDGDPCFSAGGPAQSMRHVSDAGEGGDLVWTHTTEDAAEANYGQWNLNLSEAGRYKIEVYTAGSYAQSKQAKYVVRAGGATTDVVIDQRAADGWQTLGELDLAAGADQSIHLGDNTGELLADNVQLVFDAVKITRIVDSGGEPGGNDGDPLPAGDSSGCNAGGGAGWLLGVALLGLVRRRRR
jgi:GH25 family lysozyme M1 (1,4-beta-N-acetylmuramidase)